ncbi:NADH dehydrogenase (ubiquinone) B17 subunit [Calliopsis andreniformis]|uniref:NADH dehydrogenase (ubiquinone) B17 subunit n=1 Tax=Calliopsis andreniformis TaxID=337506 RepID=UPI003FCE1BC3
MGGPHQGTSRVMNIAGRMAHERERLIGMSNEERAWRAKFVDSQILDPSEPVVPKNYYKERYNPIRRFYRFPLDQLERMLVPRLGVGPAYVIRGFIGKSILSILGIYGAWYYFKYNTGTWMRKSGWRVTQTHNTILPWDKDFENFKRKKANEYATLRFEKSPI